MLQPIIPTFETWREFYEDPQGEWSISGFRADDMDFIFTITGYGYPDHVKLFAGDDIVIDAVDKERALGEAELEQALRGLAAKLEANPGLLEQEYPELYAEVKYKVESQYDEAGAQWQAAATRSDLQDERD